MCPGPVRLVLTLLFGMLAAGAAVVDALSAPRTSGGAVGTASAPRAGEPGLLEEAVDTLVRAGREHQDALRRLLGLQEADRARAEAEVARRRDLAAKELIARHDVVEAEQRLAWLGAAVEETRQEILRAEIVITEARASVALARVPPLAPDEDRQGADHFAFGGRAGWSLARVPSIERFFTARFGRSLPVSAYGQTTLHDRLGFDHRSAVDVAVHPDTPEGRALLAYLRSEGIPFIAFRAAEAGASTGAHVHIGEPSPRPRGAGR